MKVLLFLLLLSSNVYGKVPNYCINSNEVPEKFTTPRTAKLSDIPQVVQLSTECNLCTAFIVGKNRFVSAAHCFDSPVKHITVFIKGSKVELTLIKKGDRIKHPAEDISILSGETGKIPPLKLPEHDFIDACLTVGYADKDQKMAKCYGGMPLPYREGLEMYLGDVRPGDSGGPVLNLEGQVKGVVVQYEVGGPRIYIVPLEVIKRYLK